MNYIKIEKDNLLFNKEKLWKSEKALWDVEKIKYITEINVLKKDLIHFKLKLDEIEVENKNNIAINNAINNANNIDTSKMKNNSSLSTSDTSLTINNDELVHKLKGKLLLNLEKKISTKAMHKSLRTWYFHDIYNVLINI